MSENRPENPNVGTIIICPRCRWEYRKRMVSIDALNEERARAERAEAEIARLRKPRSAAK